MGFAWSLQKVLDVAEKRELAIQAELFRLSRDIARVEEEIHRRRTMLRRVLADLAETPLEVRLARRDVLMRCRKMEEQAVEQLRTQADTWIERRLARTSDLMKISAQKDTLRRMRQDARGEYQRQLDLREQQRADEVYQMTFARRRQKQLQRQSA